MIRMLYDWATGKAPIGVMRSKQWDKVRDAFVKANPVCASCGRQRKLEVHHIMPFHLDPTRELDTSNLITLCRHCHFFVGHFLSWKNFNLNVRQDALMWSIRMGDL